MREGERRGERGESGGREPRDILDPNLIPSGINNIKSGIVMTPFLPKRIRHSHDTFPLHHRAQSPASREDLI